MGLRIRTNVASLQAQRALGLNNRDSQESMEKLSSGFRINKAADDAAGLAVSESMRARVRSLGVAQRNANDGVSLIQVAEGSMNEISNILVRLRELAVQSSSDTVGNTERSYINKEYSQLVDEIDRISATTEYNGTKLLKGPEANREVEELSIHVGSGDGTAPNTDTIAIKLAPIHMDATNVMGLNNQSEVGPMNSEEEFTRETAAQKISVLDTALTRVAQARSELGAQQNRLTSTINNLGIQIENLQSANSRVRDVDFAAETARSTQAKILATAGVSVLSQANQMPEIALTLLR